MSCWLIMARVCVSPTLEKRWKVLVSDIATCCNTLQHAATRCNTLEYTATCGNMLQHAATHCNTNCSEVMEVLVSVCVTLCSILQPAAFRLNTTAAYCSPLQHAANWIKHTATCYNMNATHFCVPPLQRDTGAHCSSDISHNTAPHCTRCNNEILQNTSIALRNRNSNVQIVSKSVV